MTAIVTIRINCDGCPAFRVLETDSTTIARRMLQRLGWRVVLRLANPNGSARSYGDKCPECMPQNTHRVAWRYAETPKHTAAAVIGDALPRRGRA